MPFIKYKWVFSLGFDAKVKKPDAWFQRKHRNQASGFFTFASKRCPGVVSLPSHRKEALVWFLYLGIEKRPRCGFCTFASASHRKDGKVWFQRNQAVLSLKASEASRFLFDASLFQKIPGVVSLKPSEAFHLSGRFLLSPLKITSQDYH